PDARLRTATLYPLSYTGPRRYLFVRCYHIRRSLMTTGENNDVRIRFTCAYVRFVVVFTNHVVAIYDMSIRDRCEIFLVRVWIFITTASCRSCGECPGYEFGH